jgi:hypothetical protein
MDQRSEGRHSSTSASPSTTARLKPALDPVHRDQVALIVPTYLAPAALLLLQPSPRRDVALEPGTSCLSTPYSRRERPAVQPLHPRPQHSIDPAADEDQARLPAASRPPR